MYATEAQAALLRAAVEEIKKHPETFDMGVWAETKDCGTVCCLAGQITRNAVTDAQWKAMLRKEMETMETPVVNKALSLMGAVSSPLNCLFWLDEWPAQFKPSVVHTCTSPLLCFCEPRNPTPEQLEARVEWWIEHGE